MPPVHPIRVFILCFANQLFCNLLKYVDIFGPREIGTRERATEIYLLKPTVHNARCRTDPTDDHAKHDFTKNCLVVPPDGGGISSLRRSAALEPERAIDHRERQGDARCHEDVLYHRLKRLRVITVGWWWVGRATVAVEVQHQDHHLTASSLPKLAQTDTAPRAF